jgi:diacylglycerol kinase (ATP)
LSAECVILFNSNAGALQRTSGPEELARLAKDVGLDAEILPTPDPGSMRRTIRELIAKGVRRIGVAGGDGTIHGAVQELAYTDCSLGILPQGTSNNFAAALRLPQDLPSAMRALRDGEVRSVDLGKVGDEYFTEAAGLGMFADALAVYGAGSNKDLLRTLYAITRVLVTSRAHRLRLLVDGKPHTERSVMCTFANSYRMGLSAAIAPEAKVTDGLLDVVVVGDLSPREYLPYYRALRAQIHLGLPKVKAFRAREVRVESRRRMNVHCDDRIIGATPVTVTAHAAALKVLVAPL